MIEPDLVRAADALVTEAQRRYVTQAYGQAGSTDPTRAASDAARGVVQATRAVAAAFAQPSQSPSKSNRARKSGPANKTRRSGENASSRRRTIKPPDRSKQDPAPGSPDVPRLATSSAKNSIASSARPAVFGRLGRQASARLRRGHGRPEASPRRAGPPGPGVRWGTTSRALRGHSGTGGGARLALGSIRARRRACERKGATTVIMGGGGSCSHARPPRRRAWVGA